MDLEFRNHALDNGMDIVSLRNDHSHSVSFGFYVETGSRDETEAESGLSHFLEHMMFKGTDTRSADDVNRRFDELGASFNAFTSEEVTGYYASVLPENLEPTLALFAEILRPALREDDFEMEKQVILEEIHMYADSPPFGADDQCREEFFADHPLGKIVLGTVDSIETMHVETMRQYFGRRYAPDNITLAATGKIHSDQIVELAQRYCGDWEPSGTQRKLDMFSVPNLGFKTLHKPAAAQQYTLSMAAGPPSEPDKVREMAAMVLANMCLGDGSGSRLFWELIDPGLVDSINVQGMGYLDAGVIHSCMVCAPEAVDENLEIMSRVVKETIDEGLTEKELQVAKNRARSMIVLGMETPRGCLRPLAAEWMAHQRHTSVEDNLDIVDSVTLELTNDMLRKYPPLPALTMTVGPRESISYPDDFVG